MLSGKKISNNIKCVWTQLKPLPDPKHGLPCPRSSHGLSVVSSGTKLVLYGGEHVARTPIENGESGWICSLNNNNNTWQWKRLAFDDDTSKTPPSRVAHAQAVHQDTKDVYIFGGRQGITMEERPLNDLWKLDTNVETWEQIEYSTTSGEAPPEPRSFHKMVCVDDSLYVFGGCGASGRLNDLHRFDLSSKTWKSLGSSSLLKGRGGPNLIVLNNGKSLGIVAGFAGEETNDGHAFDLVADKFMDTGLQLHDMRPRSVCVSGSMPSLGVALVVGGEVDPSHRGHEGAGNFENDLVLLDEPSGAYMETIASQDDWPEKRGWSSGDVHGTDLYLFGGLSGDDANPIRLDDLWQCKVLKEVSE